MAEKLEIPPPNILKALGVTEDEFRKALQSNSDQPAPQSQFLSNLKGTNILADKSMKFESAEHSAIDETLVVYTINGTKKLAKEHVILRLIYDDGPLDLRYGRVIAFAGDFFSNRKDNYTPISGSGTDKGKSIADCKDRFNDMCEAIETDYIKCIHKLSELLGQEEQTVAKAVKDDSGTNEARAYHLGDNMPGNLAYVKATWSFGTPLGLYTLLSSMNWDHFGSDAVKCYTAGHWVALEMARKAAQETNPEKQQSLLNKAYFRSAASCHFLTDLFSSGHNRVPRKAMHSTNPVVFGLYTVLENLLGLLPKGLVNYTYNVWDNATHIMHDDDSSTGLAVKNQLGDIWMSFGDKQYFMPANGVNRARCIQCVQAAIDDVFNMGFKGKNDLSKLVPENDFKALKLLPQPISSVIGTPIDENSIENPTPLWRSAKDDVDMKQMFETRKDPGDHSSTVMINNVAPDASGTLQKSENEVCANISKNPFWKEDQFPDVEYITTGATTILQAMQINDKSSGIGNVMKLNSYGTVSFQKTGTDEASRMFNGNLPLMKPTLSLRNQSKSFKFAQDSSSTATKFLSACTYCKLDSGITYFFTFVSRATSKASEYSIELSAWKLEDTAKRSVGVYFDMQRDRQEAIKATQIFDGKELMRAYTLQLRFFVGSLGKDTTPSIVIFQTASALSGFKSQIAVNVIRFNDDVTTIDDKQSSSFSIVCEKPAIDVKVSKRSNGEPVIIVPFNNGTTTGGSRNVGFYTAPLSTITKTVTTPMAISSRMTVSSSATSDPTFLTGSLTSPDSRDLIMVEHPAFPDFQFQYDNNVATGTSNAQPQVHKCTATEKDMVLIQPYLDAVITSPTSTGGTNSVINISLMKSTSTSNPPPKDLYYTVIRVHTPVVTKPNPSTSTTTTTTPSTSSISSPPSSAPVVSPASGTQWTCTTSRIPDSLISSARIESGYFSHLKFVPFDDPEGNKAGLPGILQIFSYYGVLGFRTFVARKDSASSNSNNSNVFRYRRRGQQCFNGQPSKELPCGLEGMYGCGFGVCNTPGWVDRVEFFPRFILSGSVSGSGSGSGGGGTTGITRGTGGWGYSYPGASEFVGKTLYTTVSDDTDTKEKAVNKYWRWGDEKWWTTK